MKKKNNTASETTPKPITNWVEDDPVPFPGDENAEVIKLGINESCEGTLIDVVESRKWPGRKIYKIQEFGGDKVNVVLGTVMLDRLMTHKSVGEKVKIQRLQDQPSEKGNPTQIYKTFKPEES